MIRSRDSTFNKNEYYTKSIFHEVREIDLGDLEITNDMAESESMEGDAIQGDHEANYKFDDVVAKDAIDDQADVTPQELVLKSSTRACKS